MVCRLVVAVDRGIKAGRERGADEIEGGEGSGSAAV
jgi:hypothetical protein